MSATSRYYEIEQQKLLLDFEKVALFTQHPTSLGTFRERRLRQYLRDFTPLQLSLSTGFVIQSSPDAGVITERVSRQIDCLVHDESKRHPELRTDDYVVIRPDAMFAAIEVKSTLTFYREDMKDKDDPAKFPLERIGRRFRLAGTLVDALVNIKSIKDLCSEKAMPFFGVFGYTATFDWRSFYNALDDGQVQEQLGLQHVDDFPPAICAPGKFCIHISPYDWLEPNPHHDPFRSHFNVVTATDAAPAYPLQFFTTYFLNSVGCSLNGAHPPRGGVNSGVCKGPVGMFGHHFDLSSNGYEDQ